MTSPSKIPDSWTSWNPVTGCDRISAGCAHCYAERMAHRLQRIGQKKYKNGFKVTTHDDVLGLPLKWKKPRLIFVNSMSDLFHKDVPLEFIQKIFAVMGQANWHFFQFLTKRSERMVTLAPELDWPDNVWAGVTVELANYYGRLDDLLARERGIFPVRVDKMGANAFNADTSVLHNALQRRCNLGKQNALPMHAGVYFYVQGLPYFFCDKFLQLR